RAEVHAMAHVTGGGLPGNLPRVLPEGCRARISRTAWTPPPVFATLQHAGGVADTEMFRAFNMGIGYVIVLPPKDVDRATDVVRAYAGRILNVHPSLLPAFAGLAAQRQALEYGVKLAGATVHVVDEGVDTGPVVLQSSVPVHPDDTEESLSARILVEEHRLYPE